MRLNVIKTIQSKNGQKTWIDISPKKTYRWPKGIWKDGQHCELGKCKSKLLLCNAGDPSSIPGSERTTGKGTGYPLQYSRAALVAQLVKNLPAMRETWVQSRGWEDPLVKGMSTCFSILAWRIPWIWGVWWATVHRATESDTTEQLTFSLSNTAMLVFYYLGYTAFENRN